MIELKLVGDLLKSHDGWWVFEVALRDAKQDKSTLTNPYYYRYVCVYDKNSEMAEALVIENYVKVSEIMNKDGFRDEDICYYVEYDGHKGWDLRTELEQNFGVEVDEIYK